MKKRVFALVLVVLLSIPFMAYAKTYVDEAGGFSIQIPTDANTYYYTPTDTNMTGTLLESAQASSAQTKLLVGAYNAENLLMYSLKIEALPIDTSEADALTACLAQISEAQAEEYTFSQIGDTQAANSPAKILEGTSVKDQSYSTKIVAVQSKDHVIVQTIIYKNDDAENLRKAEETLLTMTLETEAAPSQTQEKKENAQNDSTKTSEPTDEIQPMAEESPLVQEIDPDTLQPLPEQADGADSAAAQNTGIWQTRTIFGLSFSQLALILAILVAAIVGVIVLIAAARRRQRAQKSNANTGLTRAERHKKTAAGEKQTSKRGTRFK